MKKALIWSALVALLQTVVFMVVLYGLGGSVLNAAFAAAYAAAVVAFIAAAAAVATAFVSGAPVAAAVAAFAAAAAGVVDFAAAAVIIAVAAVGVFVVVEEAKRKGAQEPRWAIAIAFLPFWIGPVFGGPLYFLMFKTKNARAVAA